MPKWMKLYIQMNSYSKRNSCATYSLIIRIKLGGEIVIKNPTLFFSFFFKNTTQRYSHDSGNSIFCYRQVAIFLLSLILANSTVLIIWYRIQWVTSYTWQVADFHKLLSNINKRESHKKFCWRVCKRTSQRICQLNQQDFTELNILIFL